MRAISRIARKPAAVALALAALVLLLAALARSGGLFVPLELLAYDFGVRLRAGSDADPRVVLVTQTEDDLHRLGFPASDETLALILQRLLAAKPAAIGVDIYRDIPVPPGSERLEAVIRNHRNVVWVTKFADPDGHTVAPPAALKSSATQVGFNDLVDDPGGVIRRGLVSLDDGKNFAFSLPLQLALKYLQPRGKSLGADPGNEQWMRLGDATLIPFEKNDGGYVGADAAGYQFLIDYKGGFGRLTRYSFTELLSGNIGPSAFSGKIVVIGSAAKSLNDFFYTPLSLGRGADQRMLGAELQGLVTSQLLRAALDGEGQLRPVNDAWEVIWLALCCVLGTLIGLRSRSLARFALAALGLVAAIALASYALFSYPIWFPVAAPMAGGFLSLTAVAAFLAQMEKAQKAAMMQLFAKHVSKDIAEDIWNRRDEFLENGRPRPQNITVTVLFTDIKGYTTVSEKTAPAQLLDWLNEYMEAMAGVVVAHQGVVKQYIGDAVMAVFGVPIARHSEAEIAQDARHAVRCALEMERTLEQLNTRWREQGKPVIAMRAGIFTGPVVAGSLGGAERLEYTVIGDSVNTASRLESYDKSFAPPDSEERACRIIIGEPTYRRLGPEFRCVPVGEVELKGKDNKVSVYYVLKAV
ncbi:MAG: adenylate/guanylate cyclase domain-containing protein [Betaproteobacteria bacterium]|nr:adenylate/guanylate cyclase domain-containing protein [Betaproteobacteria bacterium]